MNAKEFLAKKGVHNLDTKKRYNEVVAWMEEYAALRQPHVSGSLPTQKVPKEFCQCKNPLVHDIQCPCGNDR